jgi:hypothetical protein
MLGYLKLGNKQNKDKITMTETELIELLDTQQIKSILASDSEYIVADLSVFNAGHVLAIELVNDFPASIFDDYEEIIDGIIIFDRNSIAEVITSLINETFYKFFIKF